VCGFQSAASSGPGRVRMRSPVSNVSSPEGRARCRSYLQFVRAQSTTSTSIHLRSGVYLNYAGVIDEVC